MLLGTLADENRSPSGQFFSTPRLVLELLMDLIFDVHRQSFLFFGLLLRWVVQSDPISHKRGSIPHRKRSNGVSSEGLGGHTTGEFGLKQVFNALRDT